MSEVMTKEHLQQLKYLVANPRILHIHLSGRSRPVQLAQVSELLFTELDLRGRRIAELETASATLLDKLNSIWNDSRYTSVFFHAANHGLPYDGPDCEDEQEALQSLVGKRAMKKRKKAAIVVLSEWSKGWAWRIHTEGATISCDRFCGSECDADGTARRWAAEHGIEVEK